MSAHTTDATYRYRMLAELRIGPIWVRREVTTARIAGAGTSLHGSLVASETVLPKSVPLPAPLAAGSAWDAPPVDTVPMLSSAPGDSDAMIAAMDWPSLQAAVASCTRCSLCEQRTRTVFGSGDHNAHWLFVGEGPGQNEDQQGEPFVGQAGKLLDNLLAAIALKRTENTFIANVVKCRPVDADGRDRAPSTEEIAACRPYLDRQIALLKPATIVALGKVAAMTLLGSEPKVPLAALRGSVHRLGGIPVVVTYHPAYLLRKPLDKAKSWRDLCLATEAYGNLGELAV